VRRTVLSLGLFLSAACSRTESPARSPVVESPAPSPEPTAEPVKRELSVKFLGVAGFQLTVGDDAVLTAPLFTNPSMVDVTIGTIASRHDLVDAFLGDVSNTKAILSGHAHYDHLLDVPYVWTQTEGATIYGNTSAKHLLAGHAPDPAPGCAAPPANAPWAIVPRENVIALDDPANDVVDYRMCAGLETCSGTPSSEGAWVQVPNSHVRIRALCSSHPDQLLVVHFGEGCVDADVCSPPNRAPDWKEGSTLAFLVDFLHPVTGQPEFRVYYQDAPFDAPISHTHPELLAEKAVDLAIVNGGNYEQVPDHPAPILNAMQPRFAILGHWENFFRPQDQPIEPLPMLNTEELMARMNDAMPVAPGGPTRHWLPLPGDVHVFASE